MVQLKKWLSDETGATTMVEAALLFPIVFGVIGFLILTSFYLLQKVTLYSDAQRAAVVVSKVKSLPGYSELGMVISSNIDFESIHLDDVRSLMDQTNPYRYSTTELSELPQLHGELSSLINSSSYLLPSFIDNSIIIKKQDMDLQVFVQITYRMDLPIFSHYVHRNEMVTKVTATTIVMDPADFIRNACMAFEWTDS